jgi:hypothetical protein
MLTKTWNSKDGPCSIAREEIINGELVYLVRTGESPFLYRVPASQLERRIEVDESWYQHKLDCQARAEKEKELERVRQDLGPYGDSLTPLKKGKAVKFLQGSIRYKGNVITRKALMDTLVSEGQKIESSEGERCITTGTDTYLLQSTIGKISLDYAEFNLNLKG